MNQHAIQVIDRLEGTAAVARLCGVKMPSVSDWKKSGIPRPWVKFLGIARSKELHGLDLEAATAQRSRPELAPTTKEAAHG